MPAEEDDAVVDFANAWRSCFSSRVRLPLSCSTWYLTLLMLAMFKGPGVKQTNGGRVEMSKRETHAC